MGVPAKKRSFESLPATDPSIAREPIYLASQLASICAVDLKTIHNWCDRQSDPNSPAELECFRTPGGHLRFRQSAVLRFLGRWGYPIPSELLLDRPQLLIIEPNEKKRIDLIAGLRLRRPGRDVFDSEPNSGVMKPLTRERTMGLFAQEHWYVHILGDAQAALIAAGERAGAGVPFSLVILRENAEGVTPHEVRTAMQSRPWALALQFVIRGDAPPNAPLDKGVLAIVPESDVDSLSKILDREFERYERHELSEKRGNSEPEAKPFEGSVARKDRIKILPREPIFVASQVAQIWNVDLKTVHNWVERGDIEAFSTPGRHLRFRRRALLHFLRRYNMPIPPEIAPKRPHLLVVCDHAQEKEQRALLTKLGQVFQVTVVHDFSQSLVQLGEQSAGASLIDAVVVFEPSPTSTAKALDPSWIVAVRNHPESKQSMLFVVRNSASSIAANTWQQTGVHVIVEGGDKTQVEVQLPQLLERTLGLTL